MAGPRVLQAGGAQPARSRRDKNLVLADRINTLATQKSELSAYSQSLLGQLAAERKQTQTLRTKIRKYSRNVRSLHKRTSSMSGLAKYQNIVPARAAKKPGMARFASRVPETPPIAEVTSRYVADDDRDDEVVDVVEVPQQRQNMDLQQKRLELQELERHTLDILNQLQEETKLLLGETAQGQGQQRRSPSPSSGPVCQGVRANAERGAPAAVHRGAQ